MLAVEGGLQKVKSETRKKERIDHRKSSVSLMVEVNSMAATSSAPLKLLFFLFQVLFSRCLSWTPPHYAQTPYETQGQFRKTRLLTPFSKDSLPSLSDLFCYVFSWLLWVPDLTSRPFLVPLASIEHGPSEIRTCLILCLQ